VVLVAADSVAAGLAAAGVAVAVEVVGLAGSVAVADSVVVAVGPVGRESDRLNFPGFES
jgi:hypothetical protein